MAHMAVRGKKVRGRCTVVTPGAVCDCRAAHLPEGMSLTQWRAWVKADLRERRLRSSRMRKRAQIEKRRLDLVVQCCEGNLMGIEGEHSEDCVNSVGLEPTAEGLRGPCSAAELRIHRGL